MFIIIMLRLTWEARPLLGLSRLILVLVDQDQVFCPDADNVGIPCGVTNRSGAPPLQGVHFLLLPCILRSGVFYETSAATNNLSSDSNSLFSNKRHNLHKNQFNIGRSFYSPRPSVVNNLDSNNYLPNSYNQCRFLDNPKFRNSNILFNNNLIYQLFDVQNSLHNMAI